MGNHLETCRRFTVLAAVLASIAAAPAAADWCDESHWGDHDDYCEVRELTLAADRSVIEVDGTPNGGIRAEGWDANEIQVEARISAHARSDERAREIASEIRLETDGVIRARGPRTQRREGWSVSFRLKVPRESNLELESSNGGISIEGVRGKIDLDTTNGGLTVRDAGGEVRGRTTNGGISVRLTGDRWDGAGLDLRSTNGGVTIEVPDGYNARLETGTTNGGIRVDFPVLVEGDFRRRMEVDLGAGGPTVKATTTNGGVRIVRP